MMLAGRGVSHLLPALTAARRAVATKASQLQVVTGRIDGLLQLRDFSRFMASNSRPGDVFCLHGEVGSGKTAFAREYVRAAAEDDEWIVPSPTFLITIEHSIPQLPTIHHMDLYRLDNFSQVDADMLSLDHIFSNDIAIIEWAEQLRAFSPPHALHISLTADPDGEDEEEKEEGTRRDVIVQYPLEWAGRLRSLANNPKLGSFNV